MNLKKIALLVLLIIMISINISNAQTLFTENFNYPVRDSIENNAGWISSGSITPNNIKVVSPGLTYPGYAGSGIGNCVSFSNPAGGDVALHEFTERTTGTVYLSFLIRVDSLTASATEGYNICLDAAGPNTSLSTQFYIKRISSTTFNAGLKKSYSSTINYSPVILSKNTTYLIVCSYTFIAGTDNDKSNLYINTAGVPATEPAVPSLTSTAGPDVTSIGEIGLLNTFLNSSLNGSSVKIDGIRIGTTWNNTLFQSINIQLNLKALIQGFYNPANNKMVKDTATVVLRYSTSPYTIADSSKAVLDSNGNGNFIFKKVGNLAPYYFVVRHRNTIETWSSQAKEFINNTYSYNFSDFPSYTYGQNVILKGSKYCMYNGDVNQDKTVDLNDVVPVYNNASSFINGYKVTDTNGDNITDLSDIILTLNNSNVFVGTIKP